MTAAHHSYLVALTAGMFVLVVSFLSGLDAFVDHDGIRARDGGFRCSFVVFCASASALAALLVAGWFLIGAGPGSAT